MYYFSLLNEQQKMSVFQNTEPKINVIKVSVHETVIEVQRQCKNMIMLYQISFGRKIKFAQDLR